MRHLQNLLAAIAITVGGSAASHAAIPEFTWGEIEVVDTEIDDFAFSSGQNAIHPLDLQGLADSLWYVPYVKGGDIYVGVRGPSGWRPPMRVTDDPALSGRPCIAKDNSGLCVVYEDDRAGHTEIWTRWWNGVEWGPEECLSLDDVPSRAPALASNRFKGIVAWQDEPEESSIRVMARLLTGSTWGSILAISQSPADATEPAVSIGDDGHFTTVVWADRRHGDAEIYLRHKTTGSFLGETRVTDMAGDCSSPSIADQSCCDDTAVPQRFIGFENHSSGVPEVWAVCYQSGPGAPVAISILDGVASHAPRISGREFASVYLAFGGPYSHYSVTWSDASFVEEEVVRVAEFTPCTQQTGAEVMSIAAIGGSAVGSCNGQANEDPLAKVLVVWPELREGVRTLVSKEATVVGCFLALPVGPPALLLTPNGSPPIRFDLVDRCTDEPVAGVVSFNLSMTPPLQSALTWDSAFAQPPLTHNSHPSGFVEFGLHGGGCSPTGTAVLKGNGVALVGWIGAKSPDVDGDCAVRDDDLAYVQAQVGTNDFCADLDGSGLVDAADVAIVEVTVGDRCTQVTGASGASLSTALLLRIAPNPMRSTGILRYDLPAAERVILSIFDVAGREVRSWASLASGAGMNLIPFDGRGDDGRELPTGWYLARVTTSAGSITQPFVRLD